LWNYQCRGPRYLTPENALKIIDKLPTYVDTAGVFVNPQIEQIDDFIHQGFLIWIQLHGAETPELCESLHWLNAKTIKAIRVKCAQDIIDAEKYSTDAILLDAYDQSKYGGTGKTFDWKNLTHINKRVFLAGGINPENILRAVEFGVYGVDICSGIESGPGKKDHKKMKQLFENIRHVRS